MAKRRKSSKCPEPLNTMLDLAGESALDYWKRKIAEYDPLTGKVLPPGDSCNHPGVPCGSFCSSRKNAEASAGKCREAMDKCGRFSPGSHV